MEKKKTNFGWRLKNSLFFVFCFIPFLQWIPFFMMNGKVPKKKWVLMGFANILVLVVAIILPMIGDAYRYNYRIDKPDNEPKRTDYVTEDYPSAADYFEEGYDYYKIDNYEDTPQYKQYLKDNDAYYETPEYKAYEKALDEYWDSPEYKAYEKENEKVRGRAQAFSGAGTALQVFGWLAFMILGFFVERYRYLRALEVNKNRDNVYGQLAHRTDMDGAMPASNSGNKTTKQAKETPVAKPVEPEVQKIIPKADQKRQFDIQDTKTVDTVKTAAGNNTPVAKAEPVLQNARIPQQAAVATVDINSATEEQLMTLPGMKTIDAKKIISYRNSHGAFATTDEFFESFEAKPHIMVKMTKSITMSKKEEATVILPTSSGDSQTPVQNSAPEMKRRFDL